MNGLGEAMAASLPAATAGSAVLPDEYLGRDGLARCSSCHGKRQLDIVVAGFPRRVRCMCKCQSDEYARRQAALACRSALRAAEPIPAGLLLPGASECTFAVAERVVGEEHVRKARRYADDFAAMKDANAGLLLFGPPSCGKTLVACAVANRVRRFGYTALVTSMTRLVNELCEAKGGSRNRLVDAVCSRDLLVVDDVGAERSTSLAREQALLAIDTRCRRKLPLIVTTNLGLSQMREEQDIEKRRVYARILEACRPMALPKRDLRAEAAVANQMRIRELLG